MGFQKSEGGVAKFLSNYVADIMEQTDTIPWVKPWKCTEGVLRNYVTDREYTGFFNKILLAMYGGTRFLTENQVAYLDGERWGKNSNGKSVLIQSRNWKIKIKKEAYRKGCPIHFSSPYTKSTGKFEEVTDPNTGETEFREITKTHWVDKMYFVYRVEDIEGLELKPEEPIPNFEPICEAEEFINLSPCPIVYGGDRACFSPSKNIINCPTKEDFMRGHGTRESFYTTLYHEMCHATGVKDILNRSGIVRGDGFGSETYGYEELVVEIAMAKIAIELGIYTPFEEKQTKAYIKSWATAIRSNPNWIMPACSEAEKIYNYFVGQYEEYKKDKDAYLANKKSA